MEKSIKLSVIKQVELSKLKPHPDNNKYFNQDSNDDIKTLKDDIAAHGVLVPLIVNKKNIILCGHRRRIVCMQLKKKNAPVQYVLTKLTADEELGLMVRDNLNRRQPGPAERERLYRLIYPDFNDRILNHNNSRRGIDRKMIAARTGINPMTINYDMSRLKRERIQVVNSRKKVQTTNDSAIAAYKKAISKMLNLATVEQKITVVKFIELTNLAQERLASIKLMMDVKKGK